MDNFEKSVRIGCDCRTQEHELQFGYFNDEPDFLYHIKFLSAFPLHKRIWEAFKYVFGYRCNYGHFDETLINEEDALKLRDFIDGFLKAHKNESR